MLNTLIMPSSTRHYRDNIAEPILPAWWWFIMQNLNAYLCHTRVVSGYMYQHFMYMTHYSHHVINSASIYTHPSSELVYSHIIGYNPEWIWARWPDHLQGDEMYMYIDNISLQTLQWVAQMNMCNILYTNTHWYMYMCNVLSPSELHVHYGTY